MGETVSSTPNTDEVLVVIRKLGGFRAGLAPQEQVIFDKMMHNVVTATMNADVEGYGMGDWLREAFESIARVLASPYSDKDEAELIAIAGAWGLA